MGPYNEELDGSQATVQDEDAELPARPGETHRQSVRLKPTKRRFQDIPTEEKFVFVFAPLVYLSFFSFLGGIINIGWLAFVTGSEDTLKQLVINRVSQWSLVLGVSGLLSGILAGIMHGGYTFGSSRRALALFWGLAWMPMFVILGATIGMAHAWFNIGFWSILPDLKVGMVLGFLIGIVTTIVAANNFLKRPW